MHNAQPPPTHPGHTPSRRRPGGLQLGDGDPRRVQQRAAAALEGVLRHRQLFCVPHDAAAAAVDVGVGCCQQCVKTWTPYTCISSSPFSAAGISLSAPPPPARRGAAAGGAARGGRRRRGGLAAAQRHVHQRLRRAAAVRRWGQGPRAELCCRRVTRGRLRYVVGGHVPFFCP